MIMAQNWSVHNMVSWNETFVAGEGLRWKSRSKALDACLGDLTWRPNPRPYKTENKRQNYKFHVVLYGNLQHGNIVNSPNLIP